MATRPTETQEFATDANYPAGSEAWSGTPTRVEPDPGDAAAGFEPGFKPPAQWFNRLFGLAWDWIIWFAAIIDSNEEHVYQAAKTRTLRMSPWLAYTIPDGAGADTWTVQGTGPYARQATANNVFMVFPLSDLLPPNGTIVVTKVRVFVDPAAARGTAAERMTIWVHKRVINWAAPAAPTDSTLVGPVRDDGTANNQVIDSETSSGGAAFSETLDRSSEELQVVIRSGTSGSTADVVVGIEVTFTQSAPNTH